VEGVIYQKRWAAVLGTRINLDFFGLDSFAGSLKKIWFYNS